jgi:protein TonB
MLSLKYFFAQGLILTRIEVPTSTLFISLSAIFVAVGAGIFWLRKHYGSKQNELTSQYGEQKSNSLERKYQEVNTFERVPTARRAGFAIALAVVLLVLNWTIYSQEEYYSDLADIEIPGEIMLDPPPTPPTPPLPKIKPPTLEFKVTDIKIDEEPKKLIVEDTTSSYDPNGTDKGDPKGTVFTYEPPKITEPPKMVAKANEIFEVVEQMPRFPGCEDMAGDDAAKKQCADQKMMTWIYSQIKYPSQAVELSIEGTTVISFVVNENGEIGNITVRKKVGGGCENEAERVIQKMAQLPQKWTPGKQGNKNVSVRYNLPVRFKLAKK